jgi:hypothetical protein
MLLFIASFANAQSATITVTLSAPTEGGVAGYVDPFCGVSGLIAPLAKGTWTFNILTNSYQFQVFNPRRQSRVPYKPMVTSNYKYLASRGNPLTCRRRLDLQHWMDLGQWNTDQSGNLTFVDTNAWQFPNRFYVAKPQ